MKTPYIALKINQQLRKKSVQVQTNKDPIFSTFSNPEHKPFNFSSRTAPFRVSPSRTAKSQDNARRINNRSLNEHRSYSLNEQKKSFCTTTRTIRFFEDKQKSQPSCEKKASQMLVIRQTLRRTQANKHAYSNGICSLVNQSRQYLYSNQSESILDVMKELQGTRCKICSPRRSKKSSKAKSKSLENRDKIKKQQLQIITDQQRVFYEGEGQNSTVRAIGRAANKRIHQQHPKISVSTISCLIISGQLKPTLKPTTANPSNPPNQKPTPQTQTNFIRAKKKSTYLNKKLANFKKQQQQHINQHPYSHPHPHQHDKNIQERIHSFRNNFGKGANTRKELGCGKAETVRCGRGRAGIVEDWGDRVEGWETSYFDQEGNFLCHQAVQLR